jgi:hypothetical protein
MDGVCTLTYVVIADPTQVDLVSWASFSCGVSAIVAIQAKDGFYCDRLLVDMFFPLVMWKFLDVYTSRWMGFIINVPTWHRE